MSRCRTHTQRHTHNPYRFPSQNCPRDDQQQLTTEIHFPNTRHCHLQRPRTGRRLRASDLAKHPLAVSFFDWAFFPALSISSLLQKIRSNQKFMQSLQLLFCSRHFLCLSVVLTQRSTFFLSLKCNFRKKNPDFHSMMCLLLTGVVARHLASFFFWKNSPVAAQFFLSLWYFSIFNPAWKLFTEHNVEWSVMPVLKFILTRTKTQQSICDPQTWKTKKYPCSNIWRTRNTLKVCPSKKTCFLCTALSIVQKKPKNVPTIAIFLASQKCLSFN